MEAPERGHPPRFRYEAQLPQGPEEATQAGSKLAGRKLTEASATRRLVKFPSCS